MRSMPSPGPHAVALRRVVSWERSPACHYANSLFLLASTYSRRQSDRNRGMRHCDVKAELYRACMLCIQSMAYAIHHLFAAHCYRGLTALEWLRRPAHCM